MENAVLHHLKKALINIVWGETLCKFRESH